MSESLARERFRPQSSIRAIIDAPTADPDRREPGGVEEADGLEGFSPETTAYQAHARPCNKLLPSIHFILRDRSIRTCQFMHLESTKEQLWIAKQLESSIAESSMDTSEMKLANRLIQESEVFDHFLAKKFPGTKRYGLEGAESMIPAMHHLFQELNRSGTSDVVLGMPHRGRLVCLC